MTIQEVNKENERPVTALENNIHAFKSPSSSPMTSPKKRQQTRSLSKALQLHEPKKYRREKPLCHNPASHSIYRHCKLLIGRDGVHDPNSFVQVSFNDENGLMDIEVNKCPVTIEKSDDQTFGKLIIKTLKAAEDLHHEAYRQHITKDLNPYCSGVKPYTRDFCLYVMKLNNNDGRQVRDEVAKYKRRSMYAKYRVLAMNEKSKRKRVNLLTGIFNSIIFADSVEEDAHTVRSELKKNMFNNVTVLDCTSLSVVLDNGHTIEIRRSTQGIICVNLPKNMSKVPAHKTHARRQNMFAVIEEQSSHSDPKTIVVGRLERSVGTEKREWNRRFMEYLSCQHHQSTLDGAHRKPIGGMANCKFNLTELFNHLHSLSLDDDIRSEARRFLRSSLLKKYERFANNSKRKKNQVRLRVMEGIMNDLMEIEQDEENEERLEGRLILSSFLMERMQKAYISGKQLWEVNA